MRPNLTCEAVFIDFNSTEISDTDKQTVSQRCRYLTSETELRVIRPANKISGDDRRLLPQSVVTGHHHIMFLSSIACCI